MKNKLQLNDTLQSILMTMSGGNPGALTTCLRILKDASEIDPDNFLGGMGVLMDLDSLGIYGSDIWMLYKDVCGKNLATTIAVLRSWQLGITPEDKLKHAISNRGAGLDIQNIISQVTNRLPAFRLDLPLTYLE